MAMVEEFKKKLVVAKRMKKKWINWFNQTKSLIINIDASAAKSTFATIAQSEWSVKIKNDRSSIKLRYE